LTVGQYLAPTFKHIPIEKYYTPDEFASLKAEALAMGFRYVESGPLVRSSYHAGRHTQGVEAQKFDAMSAPLQSNELANGPLIQLTLRLEARDN